MSNLILPQKWASQPQVPVTLDKSHPFYSRCLGLYHPANNNNRIANPSRSISSVGVGDTFLRTSSQHITIPLVRPISLTNKGATLIGIVNSADITNSQAAFALTEGVSHFSVLFRGDIAYDPISAASWNAGASSFRQFSGAPYLSGVNYVVAITTDASGNFNVYINGVLSGGYYPNTGTIPSVNLTKLEIAASNGTGDYLTGSVFFATAFEGALSASEIKALSANPWQIFKAPQRRIWVAGTSSGSTGTVAVTNANDTSSASGTTTVTGSVAKSNANDTSAASGTTTITGALARTNVNDTSAASGTTTVIGTLAKTNANDTSAASGTTTVVGTLATTNANDTVSASGAVGNNVTGTSSTTNANDTSSASGTTTVKGTVAAANVNDTSTASGTTTVKGTSATTNANDTATANGVAGIISGTVAYTNANDIATASGTTPETNRYSGGYEQEYTKGHPWIYPISRPRIEDIIPDAEPDLVEAIIAAVDVAENKVDAGKKNISSPIGSLEKEFAVAEKELKKYLKSQKQAWAEEYAAVIKAETEWRQARQQAWQQQIIEEDQLLILLLAA